jgi:hypothetical protein
MRRTPSSQHQALPQQALHPSLRQQALKKKAFKKQAFKKLGWVILFGSCVGMTGADGLKAIRGMRAVAQAPDNATPVAPAPTPPASVLIAQGNQVMLNGRPHPIAWAQWQDRQGQMVLGVSDAGLINRLGVDLADTEDPQVQPVFWFSGQALQLPTRFQANGEYRYLGIRELIQKGNWQTQIQGNTLQINTQPSQITALRLGKHAGGTRLVIDLERPTPWFISRLTNSRNGITPREFALTLENTTVDSGVARRLSAGGSVQAASMMTEEGRTVIRATLAGSQRPEVTMLSNPNRLILDFRANTATSRNIVWAPGLRWRERNVALGSRLFPVSWLEISPRQAGVKLQPIWGDGNSLNGIQPLPQIAQRWQAAAAINAGFFNRERQLPLGAIRRQGQWISGPILNRGVMAWDDQGNFRVGRLSLRHTVVVGSQRLSIADLDSGYVQAGVARYTRAWGSAYTPLTGNENVVAVTNNQVTNVQTASGPVPIPNNGFLLVARRTNIEGVSAGMPVQVQMQTVPAELDGFPNILGAGPLLVASGQVVLNAEAEQFGAGLDAQLAPRSGIGQTTDGRILLATTHNRIGGAGPSLPEWAQLMRNLGAVDALNLDGGSSSALYLGGRLVDRHSVTTTRVHNGIGVFIQPPPP